MSPYFVGIDSGSTASKCVVINSKGQIEAKGLCASGAGTSGPKASFEQALSRAQILENEVSVVCATGYGRHLIGWADRQISELSCHARGTAFQFPGVRTAIDIGGQDAKVLRISAQGELENFVMNDKCAAGTGRFLDMMASVFGCKVSQLSAYDKKACRVSTISSTCTVFAESEVISKLASGEAICNVVAGIHASVVERTYGLVCRLGVEPELALMGGVALNEALRMRFENKLGTPLLVSPLAQFNGAWGAALFALEGGPGKN